MLAKIVVPEGTNDVPVNQLIAVLAQEGEDPKAAAAAAGKGAAPRSRQRRTPLTPTLSHQGRGGGPASRCANNPASNKTVAASASFTSPQWGEVGAAGAG